MPDSTEAPTLDQEINAALAAAEDAPTEDAETVETGEPAEVEAPDTEGDEPAEGEMTASDDNTFVVTVDGKELEVPLDELLKGYQRQADYTRKTQALAEEKAKAQAALDLAEALREDPEATLRLLAENLLSDADTEELDPVQQQLRQHEEFIAAQQEQQMLAQLDNTLAYLANEYGESFDPEAVLQYAIDNNQPDLEAAYLKQQQEAKRASSIAERNAQAAARKKSAPPVAGRSTAANTQARNRGQAHTLAEALEFALEDHGLTDLSQVTGW